MEKVNTGFFREIDLSTYRLKTKDIEVAVLIRSYLNTLTKDAALDLLVDIVSIGIRELPVQSRSIKIRIKE